MLLGLCLITVALLGWRLTATAARPDRQVSGQRDLDRRFRQLHHHPERVTFHDVENLMLSDSVPAATVARVLARSAAQHLTARTMWRWAAVHGTSRLVTVVDAGVAEDTLLDHLDAGTSPDWTMLHLFAGLATATTPAGVPLDELIDLDAVPDYDDLTFLDDLTDWSTASPDPFELRQFDNLPPITGPGLAPYRPVAEWEGDGDWPEVA
ncbi:hypothetical protein [Nocardioides aquiterrae]|uniref:hypothetical protein n=1 Tax=Nocardioides aquiterrae TaxID=203799 RepID=UPI0031D91032